MSKKQKAGKTRVFVASSSEALTIAHELQKQLQRGGMARVTVWPDLFQPTSTVIENLETAADEFDFGIFVLTPDDITILRGEPTETARTNVLFELGLFMGRLGRARCLVVKPSEGPTLPSDLHGMVTLNYEAPEDDGDKGELIDLIGPVCTDIRSRVQSLGRRDGRSADSELGASIGMKASEALIKELTFVLQRLTPLLESVEGLDDASRLRTVFDVVLGEAQKIVNSIWQVEQVVVTVKTLDPNDPSVLRCHSAFELLPEHRREWIATKGFPEEIPRLGSLAGRVFDTGARQFVADVNAESAKELLSGEVIAIMNERIQSMVALPLRRGKSVIAVLKFDCTLVDLFDSEDEELCRVLDMLVRLFEHAFAVLRVELPAGAVD